MQSLEKALKKINNLLDIVSNLDNVLVYALDETTKKLESNNYKNWSIKGQPALIEHNGVHKGINIIGGTEITKNFDFIYKAYPLNVSIKSEQIVDFLRYLQEFNPDKLIIVIWDNAKSHYSKLTRSYAEDNSETLVIINQPPYSPDLNPQENVWCWLKKFISKSLAYFTEDELFSKLDEFKNYTVTNVHELKNRVYARSFYKQHFKFRTCLSIYSV